MPSTTQTKLTALTLLALLPPSTLQTPPPTKPTTAAGRKPILGYNSYDDIGCSPNSTYLLSTLSALTTTGLQAAGYQTFQIDCGWQGYERLPNGSITYDADAFPDGIMPISHAARERGFTFGLYTDQGVHSCDTVVPGRRLGSLGYEREDARVFAGWGVGYMKVDNCYIVADENAPKDPRRDFPARFGAMWDALQDVGIEEMLICQWGTPYLNGTTLEGPAEWTPPISTSFRVSDDISNSWPNVERIANENIHVNLRGLNGPGSWSDMDMLEVGNEGLTVEEQQSHFALWAMSKSTLMIGTNVAEISDAAKGILMNEGLLAINQDDLGEPIRLVQRYSDDHDLYAGPLAGGDVAVLMVDSSNASNTLALEFSKLGFESADATDLWSDERQTLCNVSGYNATVAPHGSVALRLSNVKLARVTKPELSYYGAASGSLDGSAEVQDCPGCSEGKKVGYLTANSSVTIHGIRTSQTTSNVRFDYVNCDVGYLADQKPNYRTAAVSVNGGEAQMINFPLTGYAWTLDVLTDFLVELSGFDAEGENSITISGPSMQAAEGNSEYGPDIDRIGVVAGGEEEPCL
ncbi:carbohydrate-binding module family 35 protein [Hortaea werneckii]|nr:carbohydrate-binding module family 35 protein [Hortaea werneckii]KAI7351123.1 carbohydrate-binding module family 35 protein [Hortaea werneckii]